MEKSFEIQIENFFLKKVVKAIRRKEDIIILLLETIKIFLMKDFIEVTQVKGKVILKVDKMSRLIFQIENKYFSFNFPFNIEVDESSSNIRVYDSTLGIDIDDKLISVLISIFNQKIITERCLDDIYYELVCGDNNLNINDIWILVERLSMFECGYLRYDYDVENLDGHIHPQNHLDINYSVGSTFKLGFKDIITIDDFIDILDLRTNCHYLNKI
ncbi:MAG: hypothetical protein E6441_11570 [Clostridium sp.]|uniref:hypothetical protein n=1 Tax=Clostridium sp. TaxID=1506 RepID=UPI00291380B4|nr:hypothetical protein [Clostridium sp.]MDU5210555.1 hypothetical protein [Clostridium sp.]MDU6762094.1 hypothetical protein [Clostridium sp.]